MAFSEYVNFNISANYKRALSLLQSWIWELLFNFSFPTYHIEYPHVHALRGNERKEIDGKQRSFRTLWAPFDFVIDRFWLGILRLEDTLVMKPFIKSNHVFLHNSYYHLQKIEILFLNHMGLHYSLSLCNVARLTKLDGVKIDGLLYPNFM